MDDVEIWDAIDRLVADERQLRALHEFDSHPVNGAARLRELEKSLDQCWDLLRQRRARREFGLDPDDVTVRDTETVEHYRQ
jgi:hypothetical protein